MKLIRVMEYGVSSYWPATMKQAEQTAQHIMSRNGCGHIEQRQPDSTWKITHRFERSALLVEQ